MPSLAELIEKLRQAELTAKKKAAAEDLIELPADVLEHILFQLPLAHDIAAVAPTCCVLCDAAKLALKLRPFSGEVVTLNGHTNTVKAVAAAPDGRIITGTENHVKVWRDGACVRTIQAHTGAVVAVAVGRSSTPSRGTTRCWRWR